MQWCSFEDLPNIRGARRGGATDRQVPLEPLVDVVCHFRVVQIVVRPGDRDEV